MKNVYEILNENKIFLIKIIKEWILHLEKKAFFDKIRFKTTKLNFFKIIVNIGLYHIHVIKWIFIHIQEKQHTYIFFWMCIEYIDNSFDY